MKRIDWQLVLKCAKKNKVDSGIIVSALPVILGLLLLPINLPEIPFDADIELSQPEPAGYQKGYLRKAPDSVLNSKIFSFSDMPLPIRQKDASPEGEKKAASSFNDTFKIIGTVITDDIPLALIENNDSKERTLVTVGEKLADCTLMSITKFLATFSCSGKDEYSLTLDIKDQE